MLIDAGLTAGGDVVAESVRRHGENRDFGGVAAVGQLPLYYNHLNTGRPDTDDTTFNRYGSNYIDQSNEPLYPFGYGFPFSHSGIPSV